jgi:hypothetical protein
MSVTLRYSGTLTDRSLLPRLREDFQDIAATHAWPVDLLDAPPVLERSRGRLQAPALVLEGLRVIVHPQTDPLWLTFDPDNVLTRLGDLPLHSVRPNAVNAFLHQSQASIQTGIGGSLLHKTVVGLLDYLKKAYVADLDVQDESGYWSTRDDAALRRLMDR